MKIEKTVKSKLAEPNEAEQKQEKNELKYDKSVALSNIRELLRKSDKGLGQIEEKAGFNPGYVARLERNGNTTEPSLNFIVTAAKELGVSMDYLIEAAMADLTPTEKYILNFIKNVMEDTREDKIAWTRESSTTIEDEISMTSDPESVKHPLFRWVEEYDETFGAEYNTFRYMSSFYPGKSVELYGNSYNATLPDTQSEIYIMSCKRTFGEGSAAKEKQYYEIYIVNGFEINPICCSAEVSEAVTTEVDRLYKEVEISTSHVHISTKARDAIDKYLEIKNCPF